MTGLFAGASTAGVAPLASLAAGGLLLMVPARAAGVPAALGLLVLALALLGRTPSAAFRSDDVAYGFACALALLGVAGALPASIDGELNGRRLVLARAVPATLTGFAMLAVRFADPFLAVASLFLALVAAACLAALARGPLAARAALRLLAHAVLAAAFSLSALLLRPSGGTALMFALGLLAFAAAPPFDAPLDEAAARVPAPADPVVLLAAPVAAFALLLRSLPALLAGPPFLRPVLFALALAGLLGAAHAGSRRTRARRPARFFLSLALASAALGAPLGILAALLSLAAAVLVVPAVALAPDARTVRAAAAALPPFGGAIPLALAIERAGAVSPALACLLAAAAAFPMIAMLRGERSAPVGGERLTPPFAAFLVVLLLVLAFALPDRVADGLIAASDRLAGAP